MKRLQNQLFKIRLFSISSLSSCLSFLIHHLVFTFVLLVEFSSGNRHQLFFYLHAFFSLHEAFSKSLGHINWMLYLCTFVVCDSRSRILKSCINCKFQESCLSFLIHHLFPHFQYWLVSDQELLSCFLQSTQQVFSKSLGHIDWTLYPYIFVVYHGRNHILKSASTVHSFACCSNPQKTESIFHMHQIIKLPDILFPSSGYPATHHSLHQ